MMIRCWVFLIVMTGMISVTKAQQHPNLDSQKVVPYDEFFRILVPPEEVEGRATLFKDWQQATVFLSQGRFVSSVTINYDVLNHTLLVLVEEKEYSLNPIAVDSIFISNGSQVLINPIILDGVEIETLLLRVYDGLQLSLFRNTLVEVLEDDEKTTSTTKLVYEHGDGIKIDQDQMYYLLNKGTQEFREIQGKIKELKKWENGENVVDFVKNQQLDLKEESDLIKVVAFSDQLMVDEK